MYFSIACGRLFIACSCNVVVYFLLGLGIGKLVVQNRKQKEKLAQYNNHRKKFYREIIYSITKILEIHNKYSEGHSRNVAKFASQIAAEMGLSEEEITKTYWAGMTHDIGKILIPEEVLTKETAIKELKENKESQFSPAVVEAFLQIVGEADRISAQNDDNLREVASIIQ